MALFEVIVTGVVGFLSIVVSAYVIDWYRHKQKNQEKNEEEMKKLNNQNIELLLGIQEHLDEYNHLILEFQTNSTEENWDDVLKASRRIARELSKGQSRYLQILSDDAYSLLIELQQGMREIRGYDFEDEELEDELSQLYDLCDAARTAVNDVEESM